MMADSGQRAVAVFGARHGSLGEAVAATVLNAPGRHRGFTIGISGQEDINHDPILHVADTAFLLKETGATDVVVTIGANLPTGIQDENLTDALQTSFLVNVMLPMRVLQAALAVDGIQSIVFISSNSAQIARTGSLPYCASKAALSMAIRVAARENKGERLIYGYEPGILEGTQMTDETAEKWDGPLHRIPGLDPRKGLDRDEIADLIVGNLLSPSRALNGALIRLDGGEQ